MSESNKDKNSEDKHENIFEIMDGTLAHLNKTKKMFVIMILTVLILPPIALLVAVSVFDSPFQERIQQRELMIEELEQMVSDDFPQEQVDEIIELLDKPRGFPFFKGPQFLIFVISIIWLGIGIRQWIVLSKWSKKYERFKKKQKEIDKKLDEEGNEK
jgi:hypothetical protein